MASFRNFLSEEQFQCSVCLDVFTDPVTTPCGHSFCKTCLTQYWDKSLQCHCPSCKVQFSGPNFRINATLREVLGYFKRCGLDKPEVPCDVCTGTKRKALKSCLVCLTSYCETHLEPHQRISALKRHKLIDPVENLEDYICQKHDRPLELLCKDDRKYVCDFCNETDHKAHNTVSTAEESKKRKDQVKMTQAKVQFMILERLKKINEIQHSVEFCENNIKKEKAHNDAVFTALMHSIKKSQAEVHKVMEEKQKAVERQAEGHIKRLEQEITKLKRRDTELEKLLCNENHIQVLQSFPFVYNPPHTKNWTDISINTYLSVETLRKALSHLQKTLNERLRESVLTEIKRIKEHTVDVTLDPDTAHLSLILSNDGKQVRHTGRQQNRPDKPQRFDTCFNVLGQQGFSSGRFYYEVQVREKVKWDLGVASESVSRKGQITLSPENGFWTICLQNGKECSACTDPMVCLCLSEKPQRVGVFVDYEDGLVSFYDVEARNHMYSFSGQNFTGKLYPFFNPCHNDGGKNLAPLIISPVVKIL